MEDLNKLKEEIEKLSIKKHWFFTEKDSVTLSEYIRQREKDLLYSLEDMVRQFSYEGEYRNKPAYVTGGLSALENAFRVLDWKDPHPCPENTCEWKGCLEWAHAGTTYKKGYLRCCGEHFKKAQELSNE